MSCDMFDKKTGKCYAKSCPTVVERCPEFELELVRKAVAVQQYGIHIPDPNVRGGTVLVSTAS